VRLSTQVTALRAEDGHLAELELTGLGDEREALRVTTLFICIGGKPHTEWCADEGVLTDAAGYILTGLDLLDRGRRPEGWPLDRDPMPLETSRPGLFAAGDVRHGSTKRVAGAVGDGAMAVALAYRILEAPGTGD
jgi:thioredoxin reductase (NADPH)